MNYSFDTFFRVKTILKPIKTMHLVKKNKKPCFLFKKTMVFGLKKNMVFANPGSIEYGNNKPDALIIFYYGKLLQLNVFMPIFLVCNCI